MDASELPAVAARQDICAALAACAHLADEHRPEELADRFAPGCDVRYGTVTRLRGRAELLAYLRKTPARYPATSHLLGVPAITLTGPDSADVITTVRAWHRRVDGTEMILHGRYVDRFSRTTGAGWLIASRELQVAGADGTHVPLPRETSAAGPAGTEQIIVAGWIDWAPEHRDLALASFREVTGPSLAEPGCLAYAMTPDPGDPRRIHVFEHWRRADDLTAHLVTEHVAAFRARTAALTRLGRDLNRFRISAAEPMTSGRAANGTAQGKAGRP